jgi:DNA ligase (NAD+)
MLQCPCCEVFLLNACVWLYLSRGSKKIRNLLDAIDTARRTATPVQLLVALGIPQCGRETARVLVERFRSLPAIANAQSDDLTLVPGLGPVTADAIRTHFTRTGSALLRDLAALGVVSAADNHIINTRSIAAPPRVDSAATSPVAGKVFVLTRSFARGSRAHVTARIEAHHAQVAARITRGVNYVVEGANEDTRSSTKSTNKLKAAALLNIPILSETEFWTLLME